MHCLICYEDGKIIICETCKYSACEQCLIRYFEAVAEPRCPECRIVWTQEVLSTFSTKLYSSCLKTLAKKFLDNELVLLPLTQELATREKTARDVLKNIETDRILISNQTKKFYRTQNRVLKMSVDDPKYDLLTRNLNILRKNAFKSKKSRQVDDAMDIVRQLRDISARVIRNNTIIFCKCPANACRGYIEYSTMECGFCHSKVCKVCTSEMKVDQVHKCNEADISSAETIRKETKLCPKCSVAIFKIEGCDQMWCTQCHFAFSWNTGEEDGDVVVHNPHFYEWQRQQNNGVIPRVRGDNVPVETIRYYEKIKFYEDGSPHKIKLTFFYRFSQYSSFIYPMPPDVDNTDLRVKYILNDMSLQELSDKVLERGMERLEKVEIYQIFDTFFKSSTTILSEDSHFVEKIDKLNDFINGQFGVVAKKYFSTPYSITYDDVFGYKINTGCPRTPLVP